MNAIKKQDFAFSNRFIWLFRFEVLIVISFTILFIYLAFFPDQTNSNLSEKDNFIFWAIFFFPSFLYSIHAIKTLRLLPYLNISIDNDGLWYSHLSKETDLVPWQSIVDIQEHHSERLNLIGNNGTALMRVEYQLIGFGVLRAILIKKNLTNRKTPPLPTTFSRTRFEYVIDIVFLIGLPILAWFLVSVEHESIMLGFGTACMFIFMLYHYLGSMSKLELLTDHIIVKYPLFTRKIKYDEIQSILLVDTIHLKQILVDTYNSKKPLKIEGLNVDLAELSLALAKAAKLRIPPELDTQT